jgi:hypothetical protein
MMAFLCLTVNCSSQVGMKEDRPTAAPPFEIISKRDSSGNLLKVRLAGGVSFLAFSILAIRPSPKPF